MLKKPIAARFVEAGFARNTDHGWHLLYEPIRWAPVEWPGVTELVDWQVSTGRTLIPFDATITKKQVP